MKIAEISKALAALVGGIAAALAAGVLHGTVEHYALVVMAFLPAVLTFYAPKNAEPAPFDNPK